MQNTIDHAQEFPVSAGSTLPKFSFADLLRLHSVSDVQISPDGQQIAYVLSEKDAQQDRSRQSVWLLRVSDKHAVQIALHPSGSPSWSPDGGQIAIVGVKEDACIITILQADGEVRQDLPVPSWPGRLTWSPDGQSFAFTLFVQETVAPSFIEEAVSAALVGMGKPPEATWSPTVKITQSAKFRVDGDDDPQPGHSKLFVMTIADGNLRQIGTGPFDEGDPTWMPDGASLLFASDRRTIGVPNVPEEALYKVHVADGDLSRLTQESGNFSSAITSPDGDWIAYTKYDVRRKNYTQSDLFVMRLDGSETRLLGPGLDRDPGSPRWAADGQGVYAAYTDHGIRRIGFFSLGGEVMELAAGLRWDYSLSCAGDIAYAGITDSAPPEVKLQRAGETSSTLTAHNGFLQQRKLSRLTHLQVASSFDALPIEGWALLPPDETKTRNLPTILCIHGGPFGSDGPNWSSEFQLYAAAGYAVVYANYRGSTSYGASFSEPANIEFPGHAYEDLMSVVDEAIRLGIADPNRLFVTGGSAGGHLTAWIVGKTNRFRAAVAEKPVINSLSQALTSDQYLAGPHCLGDAPWRIAKELWEQSPISLVDFITTPTLFIIGEADYRTPISETLQLYHALHLQRVPTALIRVPEASHSSLGDRPSHLAAKVAAVIAWFHKYDQDDKSKQDATG